jgi:predicted Rossmann fold nucleotide-binding protein DprA/Smf involved in DNA uptake
LAQDYDRRVFALSPTWCSEAMRGNASLIREQVAELLHHPGDLAAAMGWQRLEEVGGSAEGAVMTSSEWRKEGWKTVLDPYLARPFDDVVERCGGDPASVRRQLLEAELEGWVRCWPGDRFTRTLR